MISLHRKFFKNSLLKGVVLCLIFVLTIAVPLKAQNIITKISGISIEVKNVQLTDSIIKYNINTSHGEVLLEIPRTEVYSIQYKDGSIIIITDNSTSVKNIETKEFDRIYLRTNQVLVGTVDSITEHNVYYKDSLFFSHIIAVDLIEYIEYDKPGYSDRLVVNDREKGIVKPIVSNVHDKNRWFISGEYGKAYSLPFGVIAVDRRNKDIYGRMTKSSEIQFGSLGAGKTWGAGFGVQFGRHFGIELKYRNFTGDQFTVISYTLKLDSVDGHYTSFEAINNVLYSCLGHEGLFNIKLNQGWFYSSIGVVAVKIETKLDSIYNILSNLPENNYHLQTLSTLRNPIQFGLNSSFGVSLPIGRHLQVFTEAQIQFLNIRPTTLHFEKRVINNENQPIPEDIDLKTDSPKSDLIQNGIFQLHNWGWNSGLRILF